MKRKKEKSEELVILGRLFIYLLIISAVSSLITWISYELPASFAWWGYALASTLFLGTFILSAFFSGMMTYYAIIEMKLNHSCTWIYWYMPSETILVLVSVFGFTYFYSLLGEDTISCTLTGILIYLIGGYKIPLRFMFR